MTERMAAALAQQMAGFVQVFQWAEPHALEAVKD